MLKGFDAYSPGDDKLLKKAKALGYSFQGCYYGTGGKVLHPGHLAAFKNNEFHIITYFERNALRALQGEKAGRDDATLALEQAGENGQPAGSVIYFAVDTDVDMDAATSREAVFAYFRGISSIMTEYVIGAYGSGEVLQHLLDAALITKSVEAGAEGWQGTRAFNAQTIKQHAEIGVGARNNELGIGYDPLTTDIDDFTVFGAWLPGGELVHPVEPPAPSPKMAIEVAGFLDALHEVEKFYIDNDLYSGPIDNDPGPGVRAATSTYLRSLRK